MPHPQGPWLWIADVLVGKTLATWYGAVIQLGCGRRELIGLLSNGARTAPSI